MAHRAIHGARRPDDDRLRPAVGRRGRSALPGLRADRDRARAARCGVAVSAPSGTLATPPLAAPLEITGPRCQQIIDAKVFMVIASGGGYPADSMPCITNEGKTQYMGLDPVSARRIDRLDTFDEARIKRFIDVLFRFPFLPAFKAIKAAQE